MMLTTSPFYHQPPSMSSYRPTRSSPLAERSANALSPACSFTMASQPEFQFEGKKTPAPQRAFKPNPVMQTRDATTQRRRNMFFQRVQKDRDDRKWEARGEQIQRLDWISDQKRWEADKARQAPTEGEGWEEDDDAEFRYAQEDEKHCRPYEQESEDVDIIQAQEDEELEALVALMEEDQESHEDAASQHYGSDIDDYDQIFLECSPDVDMDQQMDAANTSSHDPDAMDMTNG